MENKEDILGDKILDTILELSRKYYSMQSLEEPTATLKHINILIKAYKKHKKTIKE